MIQIAIAEDNPRLAETLKEKILLSSDFEVKILASNGQELITQLNRNSLIDVVVMDIQMPVMDGIEATGIVTSRWPQIKVVMSTVFDDEQNLFDAILSGACGYLLKAEEPRKIHRSLFEALEGGMPMSAMIARKALQLIKNSPPPVQENTDDFGLTTRELEVLEQLSKGISYEQVADALCISYGTVRKHTENIYRKLGVSNRTGAINKAQKNRLI